MRPITNKPLLVLSTLATLSTSKAYEAHEWGTFTSLIGSNGVTQSGMYHEDEALPSFVHGFGETQNSQSLGNVSLLAAPPYNPDNPPAPRDPNTPPPPQNPPPRPCRGKACFMDQFYEQNVITQKMETPVIYFYSDKAESVSVNVKFPKGIITETFPAPVSTFPAKSNDPVLGNGEATFDVRILKEQTNKFPFVDASNIYSHARNVASNAIVTGHEHEKFVFYRGLGQFQPQIRITSKQGALKIEGNTQTMPQAAFLVDVDQSGDTRMLNLVQLLGDLRNREVAEVPASLVNTLGNHRVNSPLVLNGAQGKAAMISSLVAAGLKNDEATAMLNTWENGYLKVPGLRLLYVLPRAEVDATLPLTMTPAPQNLARVFVGRLEILTDVEEGRILAAVMRDQENFNVNALGRFSEAILRRVREVYNVSGTVKPSLEMNQVLAKLIQRAQNAENPYSAAAH